MNIATLTPIQAGLETDHDQLEFDFVARLRRVRKPVRFFYNFKSADFENWPQTTDYAELSYQ